MARPWADLTPDLLILVADHLDDLNSYVSARGACKSWRCALVPPFPALLVVTECATLSLRRPSAAPLVMRKSFELAAIASGCRCVGSSNGWLALCIRVKQRSDSGLSGYYTSLSESDYYYTAFFLVNPVTRSEIELPPLYEDYRFISKVVFTPCPDKDDFAAVAICDGNQIIYVTAGARNWAGLCSPLPTGDQLMDLVYHGEGKVYCLSRSGDVHILHLPERRRAKSAVVLQDLKLSVLRQPRKDIRFWYPNYLELGITVPVTTIDPRWKRSVEPHLNAPVRVEPLLSTNRHSFISHHATAFAPPYDVVSKIIDAKNLVLCEGNLYQVWRNTSCSVDLWVPRVGRRRVKLGEMFVLRYYPERWHCWDVVKDLGGYSFFVGKNNAVSLYAQAMPGLRGNCVYWIDAHGREKGIVFDVKTGTSTPCRPPEVAVDAAAPAGYKAPRYERTISLWYFLSDVVTTNSSDGERRN